MSIWCSTAHVGTDLWFPDDPIEGGVVLSYAEGFGNHYPDLGGTHEVPGAVGLAVIAPWCTPGHGEPCDMCGSGHDHPESGGWLRLAVGARGAFDFWTKDAQGGPAREDTQACVVLDVAAARALAAHLTAWADGPHLAPHRAADPDVAPAATADDVALVGAEEDE